MQLPRVVGVTDDSPAARAGLEIGDEIVALDGTRPRDILEWKSLVDEADLVVDLLRGGVERTVEIAKRPGEPLGADIDSAIFDEVQTCDNHCEFCFIYQLPKGMRKSLSLKDDDYRLSFLYGNFTTLTRFTELDLERVLTEGLSPLYVSIHATDPDVRADMLRNRRGASSLRWLRALLDHGVEVHGQVVVCPDLNDGAILDDTLAGVLDEFPELVTVAVVPLGISDHSNEPRMRFHTQAEAEAVVDCVEDWQDIFSRVVGRPVVFAADEYYLLADRPFPAAAIYDGFPMHEDGIGMARTFEAEWRGDTDEAVGTQAGFFSWVDGAPAAGYRAPRVLDDGSAMVSIGPRKDAPVAVLTGPYGARILAPLLASVPNVRVVEVENHFFGGNIGVSGLMVGADIARTLEAQPAGHRYLIPDVCLSEGRFLDDLTVDDLPKTVEVIPTDGHALRSALGVDLEIARASSLVTAPLGAGGTA